MKLLAGLTMDPYEVADEQIEFWNENGYLVIKELFSNKECDAINAIHRAHADKDFKGLINLDREVEELRGLIKARK